MNTIVSSWQIVSIVEEEMLIGEVLWGIIVDDPTCRFAKEDYVCTSQIMESNLDINLIKIMGSGLALCNSSANCGVMYTKIISYFYHGITT